MEKTMRAIAKTKPEPGASLIEMPVPMPEGNDVLIKVEYSAICGTDIHFYKWEDSTASLEPNMKFPFVMGHELGGTVVAVGKNVRQSRIGQRVAVEGHAYCGECYMCKTGNKHVCLNMGSFKKYQGCFADYKMTSENMLYVLPDHISFEQGALYEPGGVAMYAFEESHMDPGDVVVIYGCGSIGLLAMQIFRACGAGTIIGIDVNEFRVNMARRYADITINSAKEPALDIVREAARYHGGADVIVETTGASAVYETMFKMARPEAHIILIGHPSGKVPINITEDINLKSLNIKGHFGRKIWSSWDKLNALESSKRINLLDTVTHRFTLEQYKDAFETSIKDSGKVLFIH